MGSHLEPLSRDGFLNSSSHDCSNFYQGMTEYNSTDVLLKDDVQTEEFRRVTSKRKSYHKFQNESWSESQAIICKATLLSTFPLQRIHVLELNF